MSRFLVAGLMAVLVARAEDLRRVFPVGPGAEVDVDLFRGGIVVEPGILPRVEVRVGVDVNEGDEARAERARRSVDLRVEGTDAQVAVRARSRDRVILGEPAEVEPDVRLVVPRGIRLRLRTGDGAITVGNVKGRLEAFAEAGEVVLRQFDGPARIEVGQGALTVARCTGELTARVRQGRMRIGTLLGRGDLEVKSGDIEVLTARDAIVAEAEMGGVAVGLAFSVTGEVRLASGVGDVVVTVDPLMAFTLQARATLGRVEARLPLQVEAGGIGGSRLIGRRHEGDGPRLILRASGGNVVIQGGEVPF